MPKALSIDEVSRLLEAASAGDDPVSMRDRALLEVLYATGARISEAVGLVVDDLDSSTGCLRLLGKGARSESFPWASTPGTPWRRIWFGADLSWPLEAGECRRFFSTLWGVRCLVNPPGAFFSMPPSAPV